MESWEVFFEFNVYGRAQLDTGEGFAFWYAVNGDDEHQGQVYGHSEKFNGIGVFFDSFDAHKDGNPDPYILAMYNNGDKSIEEDGAGNQIGVCFVDYRNLPYPAKVHISYNPYENGHFGVSLSIDGSDEYKACINAYNLTLSPKTQHFGLTVAENGNRVDISKFRVFDTTINSHSENSNNDDSLLVKIEDNAGEESVSFESNDRYNSMRLLIVLRIFLIELTKLVFSLRKCFMPSPFNRENLLIYIQIEFRVKSIQLMKAFQKTYKTRRIFLNNFII
eukprot:c2188_g1_i1.p1 GENE.c2188_g1_i1~~c2188_g1_i1.p1  ORF type:complete len:277 (+),score=45.84 c2188_g1_i1:1063-1893(+)